MSLITIVLLSITAWIISYYATYHITLFLFKWIMPLKNRHGEKLWFKIAIAIPFTVGFILDIYWNVIHFSPKLYLMNRRDGIHKDKKFWPVFSRVTSISKLYEITLTKRLQHILVNYSPLTEAYKYAVEAGELLNQYDPNHLTWSGEHE